MEPILNEHNKQEYPPMHSAEHLLNGEMARRYQCGRAFSAHVERKKSKLDYRLPQALTDEELRSLEDYVNGAVAADVEVTEEFITQQEAMTRLASPNQLTLGNSSELDCARSIAAFDMSRLPEGASETVRVVHIGNYDQCLCAGAHVARTSEIGKFRISSSSWKDGVQRIVFRLEGSKEF